MANIDKIVTQLAINHRFFSVILMNKKRIVDKTTKTVWTDGKTIAFNPDYLESLPEKQGIGLAAHELWHIIKKHPFRFGTRQEKEWNEACDYAVNGELLEMGFDLPDGFLFEQEFVGKAPEEIYKIREKRLEEKEKEKNDSNTSGSEKGNGNDDKRNGEEKEEKGKDNDQSSNESEGSGKESEGKKGEGEDKSSKEDGSGNKGRKPGEKSTGKQEGTGKEDQKGKKEGQASNQSTGEEEEIESPCGEIRRPSTSLSEAEITEEETKIDVEVMQAARIAKQAGQLPGNISRVITEILHPTVPWTEELADLLQRLAKNDYSYLPPNKRYVHQGIYLPSIRSLEVGTVVLVIDGSYSINMSLYHSMISETKGLMEQLRINLILMFCDTRVYAFYEDVTSDDIESLKPEGGGGGTDFRPPFAYLEKKGIYPDVLIYHTDLECNKYPVEPDYPVIWAAYGRNVDRYTPPFGRKIIVK